MKLLNCESLKIKDFSGEKLEPYAILSHRWEGDENEITYQDLQAGTIDKQKVGWKKIHNFCRVALHNNYKYVWIDTCCINQKDLTEVTESINSMFKWYAKSAVCYTYLSDVTLGQSIEESLWFTRGWTLQELIAPPTMEFFDRDWKRIGTRLKLREAIQKRTRIVEEILDETSEARNINTLLARNSVARRMSWAAGRTTTRDEDRAYSLLGIFGVNMPLLYGEGSRAFVRLQEEIAKESNDLSILAWTRLEWQIDSRGLESSTRPGLPEQPCGVLAVSPDEFFSSHDVILRRDTKYNPEFTITNKGLKITIGATFTKENVWRISLGCATDSKPRDTIGILLKDVGGGVFVRWNANAHIQEPGDIQGHDKKFYIKKSIDWDTQARIADELKFMFHRSFQFHAKEAVKIEKAMPALSWSNEQSSFITQGLDKFEGFVICTRDYPLAYGGKIVLSFVVACGFGPESEGWVCVGSARGVNRDLFRAAQDADLQQVGVLGARSKQSKSNKYETKVELAGHRGRIKTARRADESEVLDIFVEIT